jgi:hypothetical protein
MSKRYGRNQKRAHRMRIASLEAQVAKLQKDYDQQWRYTRDLVEEIDCAKRIVGEYCVAFEPRIHAMQLKSSDFVTIMQYERDHNIGVHPYWDLTQTQMAAPVCIEQIRLPIMCVLANDRLKTLRHMVVSYDGMAYGYAIDAAAWHMERYPEALCRNIAGNLTHLIYEEMTKNMGKRPEQFRDTPRRTHTRDEPEPKVRVPTFAAFPDFLR